jgi:hypothetical protein
LIKNGPKSGPDLWHPWPRSMQKGDPKAAPMFA